MGAMEIAPTNRNAEPKLVLLPFREENPACEARAGRGRWVPGQYGDK